MCAIYISRYYAVMPLFSVSHLPWWVIVQGLFKQWLEIGIFRLFDQLSVASFISIWPSFSFFVTFLEMHKWCIQNNICQPFCFMHHYMCNICMKMIQFDKFCKQMSTSILFSYFYCAKYIKNRKFTITVNFNN